MDIDLLPDVDILTELTRATRRGRDRDAEDGGGAYLPNRLADRWFDDDVGGVLAATSNERLAAIADRLHRWSVAPAGTEGYVKAEVTAGGVDTRALSSKTMQARTCQGCTSSARSWTSPAIWAGSTSSGHGRLRQQRLTPFSHGATEEHSHRDTEDTENFLG